MSNPKKNTVEEILSRLTVKEKVGQLIQISIKDPDLIEKVKSGTVGTVILAESPTAGNEVQDKVLLSELNAIQKIALESNPALPLVFARDVIHGHRTVFPIPIGQAATWNRDLVKKGGEVLAKEGRANGIHWTFTPMLDIARDPRWGRIAESYGEDPFLSAALGEACITGIEGQSLSDTTSMIACAKHYIRYGAAEGGRDYNTTEIGENTLRNIYLPPFKAAVKAGVGSVMASFNEISGSPVTGNQDLIRRLLKEELCFEGVVLSDWEAVAELLFHGVCESMEEAANLALNAGIDIEMVSTCYEKHLEKLVHSGSVKLEILEDSVRRVLEMKLKLGLLENPYTAENLGVDVYLNEHHKKIALDSATESMVLLENKDNLLPLEIELQKILLTGPMAHAREELFGTWTLDGKKSEVESLADFCKSLQASNITIGESVLHSDRLLKEVLDHEITLIALGEHPQRSGEMNSVSDLSLPAGQLDLLKKVKGIGKPVVVLLFSGRPLDLSEVKLYADAILWAWHPGTMGAQACIDLTFGIESPSGRLPVSFPRSVGHLPCYYNYKNTGRPHTRFPSNYIDSLSSALYPFGYGLSYSKVKYSPISLSKQEKKMGETLTASISLTNTGPVAVQEVVQLYIRDSKSSMTRPVKELKGFQKRFLSPNETVTVSFTIEDSLLSYYNHENKWVVESGSFEIWIAPDSVTGESVSLDFI